MYTYIFIFLPGGKGSQCVGLTTLTPSSGYCLEVRSLNILELSGPSLDLYRDLFAFTFTTFPSNFTSYLSRVTL